jgi:hypothetical protein
MALDSKFCPDSVAGAPPFSELTAGCTAGGNANDGTFAGRAPGFDDETHPAIRDSKQQSRFIRFLDFRLHALYGEIGDVADELQCVSVESFDRREDRRAAACIQEMSIARKRQPGQRSSRLHRNLVELTIQQYKLRRARCRDGNGKS